MWHNTGSMASPRQRMPLTHGGRFVLLITALTMLLISTMLLRPNTPAAQAQTWTLAWSDEFNGSGAPSSANWNYNVGNGRNPGLGAFDGWGNGEWEWYRPENCSQSGGNLVIRADWLTTPMVIDGRNWYQRSCRLTTDTHRSFTYGRIEARMALPNAAGSWPAFWLMGDACDDTSTNSYNPGSAYWDTMATNWASCGEVDIMEHKNSDTTIVNNIFWDTRTGVFPWTSGMNANYVTTANVGNVATFHTYEIRWDSSFIRWYTDGVQTHVIDITPATLEEFKKPMHIILNLALGGAFPATSPVQSQFPLSVQVDYVRYYTAGGGGTNPTAVPPTPGGGGGSGSINSSTWYSVQNVNSNRCLDADAWGTANGTRIIQWDCNAGGANQHWLFVPTDSGYYRVMNRNPNPQDKALEIAGGSGATGNGAKAQLWQYVGGTNQQWKPELMGTGIWRLRARHSNRCLDVPSSSTANGVQLQQWDCNSSNAQNFRLIAR
jgi:beta-glucanase (GH16 family)